LFDHIPHNAKVYVIVAVNNPVTHSSHITPGNCRVCPSHFLRQPLGCFSHNLKGASYSKVDDEIVAKPIEVNPG